MAYDGAGNFTRLHNWVQDRNNSIKIVADRHDAEDDGFAQAFNQVLLRSGVAPMEGDLKMGSNAITGIKAGSEAAPSVSFTGDVTTGMYLSAPGVVTFTVGSTDRGGWNSLGLYLDNAFLGINTATPRYELDVVGETAVQAVFEKTLGGAVALTGVVTLNVKDGVQYVYTSNAAGNFSLDIVADTGVDLDDLMDDDQSCTLAIEVPQGATAYYLTGVEIDGNAPAQTKWYDAAPTQGNANSIDVYAVTIHKRSAGVFWVRISQARLV